MITNTQPGSRILPLEDADLLPQGDELQSEVMSRAEEGTEPRKKAREAGSWAQFYVTQSAGSQIPASY